MAKLRIAGVQVTLAPVIRDSTVRAGLRALSKVTPDIKLVGEAASRKLIVRV